MTAFEPISVNGHTWPNWGSWWCDTHQQVCNPWKPITVADLLAMAAADDSLDDGAFVALSRAARGDDPADTGGDL